MKEFTIVFNVKIENEKVAQSIKEYLEDIINDADGTSLIDSKLYKTVNNKKDKQF